MKSYQAHTPDSQLLEQIQLSRVSALVNWFELGKGSGEEELLNGFLGYILLWVLFGWLVFGFGGVFFWFLWGFF